MNKILKSLVLIGSSVTLFAGNVNAQNGAALDPQDYIDIRQLIEAYPRILDNCTNGGNDYADLFTDDATFGVSSEWGSGAKVWFRGREQIRVAGGGGPNGCVDRPSSGYHLVISPVITATPDGAGAISTLLTIANNTGQNGDAVHWEGGYEDTFEKTPNGWKFKSRLHVWPEIEWTDRPEDMPPRDLSNE